VADRSAQSSSSPSPRFIRRRAPSDAISYATDDEDDKADAPPVPATVDSRYLHAPKPTHPRLTLSPRLGDSILEAVPFLRTSAHIPGPPTTEPPAPLVEGSEPPQSPSPPPLPFLPPPLPPYDWSLSAAGPSTLLDGSELEDLPGLPAYQWHWIDADGVRQMRPIAYRHAIPLFKVPEEGLCSWFETSTVSVRRLVAASSLLISRIQDRFAPADTLLTTTDGSLGMRSPRTNLNLTPASFGELRDNWPETSILKASNGAPVGMRPLGPTSNLNLTTASFRAMRDTGLGTSVLGATDTLSELPWSTRGSDLNLTRASFANLRDQDRSTQALPIPPLPARSNHSPMSPSAPFLQHASTSTRDLVASEALMASRIQDTLAEFSRSVESELIESLCLRARAISQKTRTVADYMKSPVHSALAIPRVAPDLARIRDNLLIEMDGNDAKEQAKATTSEPVAAGSQSVPGPSASATRSRPVIKSRGRQRHRRTSSNATPSVTP
jgi:hypothetical protein